MLLQKQVQVHFNQTKRHMKIIHTEHKYLRGGGQFQYKHYI